MSGNKTTDVKSTDELDMDSGFQSGPMDKKFDEDDESSELVVLEDAKAPRSDVPRFEETLRPKSGETKPPSDDKKVCSFVEDLKLDSGVVDDDIGYISAEITDLKLKDQKPEKPDIEQKPDRERLSPKNFPVDILFQQDDDGDTQLHIAAIHGYEKPVSTLIRVCPKKELLNLCNDYGQTALHLAVMSQSAIVTRMLVLAGADIGIRDRKGETPLHIATTLSSKSCIQALLTPVGGQQRKISSVLNQKNYQGQACVHVAASLGHIESLQTLLFYGADINSRENMAGWTALHIAAMRGDARLVQQLQRCSAVQPRARDYAGRTPRRLAHSQHLAALFTRHDDSDTDTDTDDDMFDEEVESWFETFSNQNQTIVA